MMPTASAFGRNAPSSVGTNELSGIVNDIHIKSSPMCFFATISTLQHVQWYKLLLFDIKIHILKDITLVNRRW